MTAPVRWRASTNPLTDARTFPQDGPIRWCLARWVIVAAACGALHVATTARLALPPPWQPLALVHRVGSDGPFVGAVALAHLAVTVVGWYVIALVTAGVGVRVGGAVLPGSTAAAWVLLRHLSLPGTRSLLAWSIGIASLAGPTLATRAAFAAGSPPPTMTASPEGHGRTTPPVMSFLPRRSPETWTRPADGPHRSPVTAIPPNAPQPNAPQPTPPPMPPHVASTAPASAPGDVAPTTTTSGTWVVRPGDHLWSISERTLTAARGAQPALGQLGPYWWQVVTVNRPTLPDPANIDLLFPGDVVTLPPLPHSP